VKSSVRWARLRRHGLVAIGTLTVVVGLVLGFRAGASAAAVAASPLPSGVSTTDGSWVVLPMGELSDPANTFWQVLHAVPGVSHWSVVTPRGVADNGGLVTGATVGSVVVGFLPSQLLRFSPLAVSSSGGRAWTPQLLPVALAADPDALASGPAGDAVAAVVGDRVLTAPPGLSHWSSLVTVSRLARLFPRCGVTSVDAVAVLPSGAPLVATGCDRGGIGIFTETDGAWSTYATASGSAWRSATQVLRLEATGSMSTALVRTRRNGHPVFVGAWRGPNGAWTFSSPLSLPSRAKVRASAVGDDGALAMLVGSDTGGSAYTIDPNGAWRRLPAPPTGTAVLAIPTGTTTIDTGAIDAFTVRGGALVVYGLTPSGSWVRVQSSRVAIAYGSSG
jgi:hypothetical protein